MSSQTATEPRTRVQYPPYARGLNQARRYKVLYGGRGAARSWTVARKLLVKAGKAPLRVLCARELQKSIKDSVHKLLTDQIEMLGLPGFEVTQTEIRHASGSLFIFEGLKHNITKIKSLEGVDICWVEEAERVSDTSWEVLIPTIRKPGSEIWITFNPDLESDPTYRRFVLQPPPDAWVKKVSHADNPWFPEPLRAEMEYLRRVDPDAYAHVWEGETRHATDAQILKDKWKVEEFEPGDDWDGPYHGADWGFAQDPTTLVRCYIHGGRLYVSHESYQIGLELDHTKDVWGRQVPGAGDYVIRADSARPESISYLRRHGVTRIEGAPKWSGSVEDGIAHLRQYERIVIHPRCKHTIDEARHYSYKVDDRTGDVLPKIVDAHNHCIDAIRYALAPLIQQRGKPWAFAA